MRNRGRRGPILDVSKCTDYELTHILSRHGDEAGRVVWVSDEELRYLALPVDEEEGPPLELPLKKWKWLKKEKKWKKAAEEVPGTAHEEFLRTA